MRNPVVVIPAYNEQLTIGVTLDSLVRQTETPEHIIVVDNASTDDTAGIVHDQYPTVTLLHESRKGTGYAVNTGFRFAIDDARAKTILRTDADTVPRRDWVEAGSCYMNQNRRKLLATGPVKPLQDKDWRIYDEAALPIAYAGWRAGVSLLRASLWPIRVARGGNMAVRADAYEAVDGFPDGDISEIDDDVEFSRRIYEEYGFASMANVRSMQVRTSMRRFRQIGYTGLIQYYLNFSRTPLAEVRARMTDGNVDLR